MSSLLLALYGARFLTLFLELPCGATACMPSRLSCFADFGAAIQTGWREIPFSYLFRLQPPDGIWPLQPPTDQFMPVSIR